MNLRLTDLVEAALAPLAGVREGFSDVGSPGGSGSKTTGFRGRTFSMSAVLAALR
jgi:hypothetical protein